MRPYSQMEMGPVGIVVKALHGLVLWNHLLGFVLSFSSATTFRHGAAQYLAHMLLMVMAIPLFGAMEARPHIGPPFGPTWHFLWSELGGVSVTEHKTAQVELKSELVQGPAWRRAECFLRSSGTSTASFTW